MMMLPLFAARLSLFFVARGLGGGIDQVTTGITPFVALCNPCLTSTSDVRDGVLSSLRRLYGDSRTKRPPLSVSSLAHSLLLPLRLYK